MAARFHAASSPGPGSSPVAIFAKADKKLPEKTSHLLIESNEWQQDDSPDHALWTRIDWARAHGEEDSDGLFRYYNGGFLASKGIRGQVILRGNRIMDAYNGVRMKANEPPKGISIFWNSAVPSASSTRSGVTFTKALIR